MPPALRPSAVRIIAMLLAAIDSAVATPAHGIPVGQPLHGDAIRPPVAQGSLRAARAPVRVHGVSQCTVDELRDALSDAERAYELIVDRMHFPAPLFDGTRGGGPELDLYLVDHVPFVRVEADAIDYSEPWDCAPAVILVRRDLPAAARRRAITEGVAHASLLAADAREARAYRMAFASAIAARALGEGADDAALALAARDIGAGLFVTPDDDAARGEAVFFDLLSSRFDDDTHSLWRGLAQMLVARTPGGAARFVDEPDPFDALRRLLRAEPGGFDGFLLDYYIARALTGNPGDRFESVGFRADPNVAPKPLRTVHARNLPQWILSSRPLGELGAAYVVIETTGLQQGTLSIWFHGAPWLRWAVTAVRLDGLDRDRGRAPSPPVLHGEWSTSIELDPLDARILVVVMNKGEHVADLDRPADRDGSFAINLALSNAVADHGTH